MDISMLDFLYLFCIGYIIILLIFDFRSYDCFSGNAQRAPAGALYFSVFT